MGFFVLGISIMYVIGNNQRNVQFFAHFQKCGIHCFLFRDSVILHFQKKIPFPETCFVFQCRLLRFVYQPFDNIPLYLSRQAGGKGNHPFVKFIQHFHIYTRPIIVPFRKTAADYFHQIGISRVVFCQQYQMIISVFPPGQFFVKP